MWLKRPSSRHEPPVCAVSPCLLRRIPSSRRSVKQMSSRELKVLNLPLRAAELSATLEVEKCDSATNVRATSFEHTMCRMMRQTQQHGGYFHATHSTLSRSDRA